MRLFFRVEAVGVNRMPKDNCVIAPNHVSYLDPFVIAAALDHAHLQKLRWAGWTGAAFRGPLRRWVSRLARAVPVDPDRGVISSLALAAAVLKRRDTLVWFPEGVRSPDGRLQPLRPGIGMVLEHQPATVIPTLIEGAHEAMPPGRFLPRPRRIRVTFDEAVESKTLEHEGDGDEPRERITSALQKRLERLAHSSSRK
jgi:long-chain acyl-CoA synthetase